MDKSTSVILGPHYDELVDQLVKNGQYESATETIRAGLRLLEEREMKLEALREALREGEESGTVEFNLEELIAELDAEDQLR